MTKEVDPIDPSDGTSSAAWDNYVGTLAPLTLPWPPGGRLVVVAPHPDDEILPTGATLAAASDAGADITVIAVTDGDASHPHLSPEEIPELVARRTAESEAAYAASNIAATRVRLGFPDGQVTHHAVALTEQLAPHLRNADVVIAPLPDDGHPDHDIVGTAVSGLVAGQPARLLFVPIWSWNWRPTDGSVFPAGARYDFEAALLNRKRAAIACYDSQINDIIADGRPGLLPSFLAHFDRPTEVFFPAD